MTIYFIFSLLLFFIGLLGAIISRRYLILTLISIELMLLAINLNFIISSIYLDDFIGQIYALIYLTIAAAESAIGLAIVIIYYRLRGSLNLDFINSLKS
jgi:NADH-quinone oxidoreductase subunit K